MKIVEYLIKLLNLIFQCITLIQVDKKTKGKKMSSVLEGKNRILYYDYLRICATLAVIILHVVAIKWSNTDITSFQWQAYNIAESAGRCGVPIFVMISGALLLDNDKHLHIKRIYTHNIFRIVTAFIFWSAIYTLQRISLGTGLKDAVKLFVVGEYHMWFLYMIIGLYIIIPIVRKITESKIITEYFLIIVFIVDFLIPRLFNLIKCIGFYGSADIGSVCDNIYSSINFSFPSGYIFYFVLGFYLSKYDICVMWRRISYIAGIFGYVVTILFTYWYSIKTGAGNGNFYYIFSINIMLMCIGVFLFARYVLSRKCLTGIMLRMVLNFSKYSFGIYLVHALVINKFQRLCNIDTLTFNPIVSVIIVVMLVTVISYVISAVLNHIPVLRKYTV